MRLSASALTFSLALGLGAVSTPVLAQKAPFQTNQARYVGGSLGTANDYGSAFKVFYGTPLMNNLHGELQYLNFGKDSGEGWSVKAQSLGASALLFADLARDLRGFGKLGLHYVDASYRSDFGSGSDSGIEIGFGLGLLYRLGPTMQLRGEYESIGGDAGSSVVSIGLQFDL